MQVCVLTIHLRLETSILGKFLILLLTEGTFTRYMLKLVAKSLKILNTISWGEVQFIFIIQVVSG